MYLPIIAVILDSGSTSCPTAAPNTTASNAAIASAANSSSSSVLLRHPHARRTTQTSPTKAAAIKTAATAASLSSLSVQSKSTQPSLIDGHLPREQMEARTSVCSFSLPWWTWQRSRPTSNTAWHTNRDGDEEAHKISPASFPGVDGRIIMSVGYTDGASCPGRGGGRPPGSLACVKALVVGHTPSAREPLRSHDAP